MVEHRAELKTNYNYYSLLFFFLGRMLISGNYSKKYIFEKVITFSNELAFFRFSKVEGQQQIFILALNVTTSKL